MIRLSNPPGPNTLARPRRRADKRKSRGPGHWGMTVPLGVPALSGWFLGFRGRVFDAQKITDGRKTPSRSPKAHPKHPKTPPKGARDSSKTPLDSPKTRFCYVLGVKMLEFGTKIVTGSNLMCKQFLKLKNIIFPFELYDFSMFWIVFYFNKN